MLNWIGAAIGWVVAVTPAITIVTVMYNKHIDPSDDAPSPAHVNQDRSHSSLGGESFVKANVSLRGA